MQVLIVEDDAFARRFLSRSLINWGYEVTCAESGEEAWEILQANDAPRLALVGGMLPGMGGLELCSKIRQRDTERSTYVILLTSNDETADLVSAINAGADDFVTKSSDSRELEVRLRAARRILELEEALWRSATHDPMTKLWNRGAIISLLQREIALAKRQHDSMGVIMVDIDHFKKINDTLGHKAGDVAIVEVAQRMALELRDYDMIGRYGGEEFIVVLPGGDSQAVVKAAERLRLRIADQPFLIEGAERSITISLGTALAKTGAVLDMEQLIRKADEALYDAKNAGRNCVKSFELDPPISIAS